MSAAVREWQRNAVEEAIDATRRAVMSQRVRSGDSDYRIGHAMVTKQFDGTPMDLFLSKVVAEKYARFERAYGARVVGVEVCLEKISMTMGPKYWM